MSHTDLAHFGKIDQTADPATFMRFLDAACAARPGNVSRNTWIAEAVQEKLAREPQTAAQSPERRAHG